jgi:hypothetical protein
MQSARSRLIDYRINFPDNVGGGITPASAENTATPRGTHSPAWITPASRPPMNFLRLDCHRQNRFTFCTGPSSCRRFSRNPGEAAAPLQRLRR